MIPGSFKVFIEGKEQGAFWGRDLMMKARPAAMEVAPIRPEVVYQGEISGTIELALTETEMIERVLFYKSCQLGRYMPLDLAIYAALWRGKGPHQFWAQHQLLQGRCRLPRGMQQKPTKKQRKGKRHGQKI